MPGPFAWGMGCDCCECPHLLCVRTCAGATVEIYEDDGGEPGTLIDSGTADGTGGFCTSIAASGTYHLRAVLAPFLDRTVGPVAFDCTTGLTVPIYYQPPISTDKCLLLTVTHRTWEVDPYGFCSGGEETTTSMVLTYRDGSWSPRDGTYDAFCLLQYEDLNNRLFMPWHTGGGGCGTQTLGTEFSFDDCGPALRHNGVQGPTGVDCGVYNRLFYRFRGEHVTAYTESPLAITFEPADGVAFPYFPFDTGSIGTSTPAGGLPHDPVSGCFSLVNEATDTALDFCGGAVTLNSPYFGGYIRAELVEAPCVDVAPPICITVLDNTDSSPISGATVTIKEGATTIASGSTDANGEICFDEDDGLEPATEYEIQVSAAPCTQPTPNATFELGDPDITINMNCPEGA